MPIAQPVTNALKTAAPKTPTYTQPTAQTPVNMQDYNAARDTYAKAEAAALPSAQSMDNAAARVRARLAGQAAGQRRTLGQNLAGRGVSNSGIARYANLMQSANEQAALGGALSDLEAQNTEAMQTGAKILQGIGEGRTALGTNLNDLTLAGQKAQSDYQLAQQQAERERQKNIMDTLLGTSSMFGQYGNTQFHNQRKNQWEQLLAALSGLSQNI